MLSKETKPPTVPQQIVKGVITLHRFICKDPEVNLNCAPVRAIAMAYLKKCYRGQADDDSYLLYLAVAALHLASKVYDEPRCLPRLVTALDNARNKPELCAAFPCLSSIKTIGQEFRSIVTNKLIRVENDLIFLLDFKLKVLLPYEFAQNYVDRIIHWHIDTSDPLYNPLLTEIYDTSSIFLNDLMRSHLFFQYPPDIIAQAAVRLTFELYDLPLVSPNTAIQWYGLILPFRDECEMCDAYQQIRQVFIELGVFKSKRQLKNQIHHKKFTEWYITPVDDLNTIDKMCPPPPLEMMKQISGENNAFNELYTDRKPKLEPPPIELMEFFKLDLDRKKRFRSDEEQDLDLKDYVPNIAKQIKGIPIFNPELQESESYEQKILEDRNRKKNYNEKFKDRNTPPFRSRFDNDSPILPRYERDSTPGSIRSNRYDNTGPPSINKYERDSSISRLSKYGDERSTPSRYNSRYNDERTLIPRLDDDRSPIDRRFNRDFRGIDRIHHNKTDTRFVPEKESGYRHRDDDYSRREFTPRKSDHDDYSRHISRSASRDGSVGRFEKYEKRHSNRYPSDEEEDSRNRFYDTRSTHSIIDYRLNPSIPNYPINPMYYSSWIPGSVKDRNRKDSPRRRPYYHSSDDERR